MGERDLDTETRHTIVGQKKEEISVDQGKEGAEIRNKPRAVDCDNSDNGKKKKLFLLPIT
jgi:hypothetical protein